MKIQNYLVCACLALTPMTALAQPKAGDGLFTISGAGSSDKDFDSGSLGLSFDLGKFMSQEVAFGIRQSVNFADSGDDSSWNGATRGFADYHFDLDALRPFVGASLGGIYGDDVDETFFAGPELGAKYYVKPETYITLQGEYQFFFDSASDADDNFDDGAFVYSVGIGFNF
ncbi:hypothetical protein QQM79_09835 [Marinobacteraceae bacterium S3BR75-40.1]